MKIFEDTRNQIDKHKRLNDDLKELGHEIIRTKLYVGDYAQVTDMSTCVDTKKDWVELAGNICGKQHERFRDECIRAKEAQIRLIVLVEEETSIEEWKSPRKRNGEPICKVANDVLKKAMKTMSEKYGVEFMNCNKNDTATKITKILGGENV